MIPQLTVHDLKAKLDAGEAVHLLDVRNPDEHAYCRLPDSQLVPLPELAARVEEIRPPEGSLLVVYCHHGVRSLRAAGFLQHSGLANVASLAGGIEAWSVLIDPTVPRY